MSEFTASNGITVANHGGNWDRTTIHFEGELLGLPPATAYRRDMTFNDRDFEALREFFQKENDDRFDRWRWPANPEYVVYAWTADAAREARGVTVLSESIPRGYTVWEDNVDTLYGTSENEEARAMARKAARAYFDAHPEPKPWHDAKPGDVWILSHDGGDEYPFGVGDGAYAGDFVYAGGESYFRITDPKITAGRRIWPEVAS